MIKLIKWLFVIHPGVLGICCWHQMFYFKRRSMLATCTISMFYFNVLFPYHAYHLYLPGPIFGIDSRLSLPEKQSQWNENSRGVKCEEYFHCCDLR